MTRRTGMRTAPEWVRLIKGLSVTASLGDPTGALRAVEAASASTHAPGPTERPASHGEAR
jgi:hypothetical protein